MNEAKLPPLPPYIYGRECGENERVLTEAAAREYGALCARQERERCAAVCNERAADVRKANTYRGRVSSATLFAVDQLELAAAVIAALEDSHE